MDVPADGSDAAPSTKKPSTHRKGVRQSLNAPGVFASELTSGAARASLCRLRDRSKVAAGKLEELKAAGEDRWEAMVVKMDQLRDAFVHSFHHVKSQI